MNTAPVMSWTSDLWVKVRWTKLKVETEEHICLISSSPSRFVKLTEAPQFLLNALLCVLRKACGEPWTAGIKLAESWWFGVDVIQTVLNLRTAGLWSGALWQVVSPVCTDVNMLLRTLNPLTSTADTSCSSCENHPRLFVIVVGSSCHSDQKQPNKLMIVQRRTVAHTNSSSSGVWADAEVTTVTPETRPSTLMDKVLKLCNYNKFTDTTNLFWVYSERDTTEKQRQVPTKCPKPPRPSEDVTEPFKVHVKICLYVFLITDIFSVSLRAESTQHDSVHFFTQMIN